MARIARRRLSATHQSAGRHGRGTVVEVHAVDRGRSFLPGAQERTIDSTAVSSTGTARQSPRDGRVPGLCALGYFETPAQAAPVDKTETNRRWDGRRSAVHTAASTFTVIDSTNRRHCPAHHRWPRNSLAPDYLTHHRAEIFASPAAQAEPPGSSRIQIKM